MTDALGKAAIERRSLASSMRAQGLNVVGELTIARIGQGQSNLTYVATDRRENRWIVRRPPLGILLHSAHDLEREYKIMQALAPTSVPVPRMYLCLPAGGPSDVAVVVMEYVEGLVVDGFQEVARLDGRTRARLLRSMALVLSALHSVDPASIGLAGLSSHGPYAPRQIRRWDSQWRVGRTAESPALNSLTDVLRRNAPPSRAGVSLIHGDFSPRNLIVDSLSGSIRAVVDWELATLGEPLADVGTVLAYWAMAGSEEVEPWPPAGDAAAFLEDYSAASGIDGAAVGYWLALSLWKLAIISDGVARRIHDEPDNRGDLKAPGLGEVEHLLSLAGRVVQSIGMK